MSEAVMIMRQKRRDDIRVKKTAQDTHLVENLLQGYKYLSVAGKARFAFRLAQYHDNTETPSPFGGAL